jgi:alpha-tubulin suppressor-like RCC1 family protein
MKAVHGDASVDGGGDLGPVDGSTDAPARDTGSAAAPTDSLDGATEAAAGNLCTGVVQVTADMLHACAVKTDGTMWCWGANGYG